MTRPLKTHQQRDAYSSPWSLKLRVGIAVWRLTWGVLAAWTPKPMNKWRLLVLQTFGGKIHPSVYVDGSARIWAPWNLVMHKRACVGSRVELYNPASITLGEASTVAQESFLCTATHDFAQEHLPLQTAPIVVEARAFLSARTFVLPGVTIGEGTVTGACSVVTKDIAEWKIAAGNPCRVIRDRDKPESKKR